MHLKSLPELPLNVYGLEKDLADLSQKASDLFMADKPYEALDYIRQAVRMKRCIPTLLNTAVILTHIGRFQEAFPYLKEAYELLPEDENVMLLYGEALLRFMKFEEGWPLFLKRRSDMPWLDHWLPEWVDQPVAGRRIAMIEREGTGVGDNLYFFRNVVELAQRGAKLTVICRPTVIPLVASQGFKAIANYGGHCNLNWANYDYYCPMVSLGAKLGMTWKQPYIKVKKPWWKTGRRVGFCWKAGETLSQKTTRFLTPEQNKRIVEAIPRKYDVVNLTYEQKPIGRMKHGHMADWLETARTIAQCDLVVSVDTGVSHLCGAMGVPVWVILPGAAAWHYPLGYSNHPFYPSMKMFRNPYEGMEEAVNEVCFALEAL